MIAPRSFTLASSLFTTALLGACSSEPDPAVFPDALTVESIESFLDAEEYKQAPWTFDPAIREGTASFAHPGARLRVYFNPTAVESIQAGNGDTQAHLPQSMVIKELYDQADQLLGKAVSLKVETGLAPSTWVFYCRGPATACGTSNVSETQAFLRRGQSDCLSCHGENYFAPLPGAP